MIHDLKVIHPGFEGVNSRFPLGHVIDINSSLVMVVGPNGAGKTGFTRMFYDSIRANRYFEDNGISMIGGKIDDFSRIINTGIFGSDVLIDEIVSSGDHSRELKPNEWMPFNGFNNNLGDILYGFPHLGFDASKHLVKDVEYKGERFSGSSFDSSESIEEVGDLISQDFVMGIHSLEEMLRADSIENRWMYMQPALASPNTYVMEIIPHIGSENMYDHVESSLRKRAFHSFDFSHMSQHTSEGDERYMSPGNSVLDQFRRGFEDIRTFFDEKKLPIYENTTEVHNGIKIVDYEDVAADAELLVFMDEPTNYMDMVNKRRLKRMIVEEIEKRGSRIQFVMTTNDEGMFDCYSEARVVNLHHEPAQSQRLSEFSIPEE